MGKEKQGKHVPGDTFVDNQRRSGARYLENQTLEARDPVDDVYVRGGVGDTTNKYLADLARRNPSSRGL